MGSPLTAPRYTTYYVGMVLARATVTLPSVSLLPEDAAVNVWHFESFGDFLTSSDMGDIAAALQGFYAGSIASLGIGPYFGPSRSRATDACRIDIAQVSPGALGGMDDSVSPILDTRTFTLPAAGNAQGFPEQVAIALSLEASLVGVVEEITGPPPRVRPAARRRGRIYLGPLHIGLADSETTTNRCRVSVATRNQILAAAEEMNTKLLSTPEARIVVYSRAGGVAYPVVNFAVDDRFDVVRRRGMKRQVKQYEAIVPPVLGA